jgi:hypothetical protein
MMYDFMGIWAIEIVEMTSRKKLTPEKVVREKKNSFENFFLS